MNYWREFLRYAIPSCLGMAISSLYVITDGIFIGRGVGSTALAAINIVWPLIAVIQALSMMIAVGGGALMAIRFGEKKFKEGNDIFLQSGVTLCIAIVAFSLPPIVFAPQVSALLGATPLLLPDAVSYLRYFLLFGIFWCISIHFAVFVRNDGNPNLAFLSVLVGAGSNIVLDYLFIFVFHWGVAGAAIASGLGQMGSAAVLLLHFIQKRGHLRFYRFSYPWRKQWQIIKVGTPEFTNQLAYPLNIFFFNIVLIRVMDEMAVAAYCIISYVITVAIALLLGVANGIQPLLSHSYGSQDKAAVRAYFRIGFGTNLIFGLLLCAAVFTLAPRLVAIINTEPALIALTVPALRTYSFSIVFTAITLVTTTYFLATKQTRTANTISIGRGLVANALFIPLVPFLFGVAAVWSAGIWAEAASSLLALLCLAYARRGNAAANRPETAAAEP